MSTALDNFAAIIGRVRRFGGVFAVVAGLCFSGCSKHGEQPGPQSSVSFDSAPGEVPAKWKQALSDAAAKHYLDAERNLQVVLSNADKLTPEQNDAAQQVWQVLGNKAFEAADKGDSDATKAVFEMKDSKFNSGRAR